MLTSPLMGGGATSWPSSTTVVETREASGSEPAPDQTTEAAQLEESSHADQGAATAETSSAAPAQPKPAQPVQTVPTAAAVEVTAPTDVSQARAQALQVQSETRVAALLASLEEAPEVDLLAEMPEAAEPEEDEGRPALNAALKGYAQGVAAGAEAKAGYEAVM